MNYNSLRGNFVLNKCEIMLKNEFDFNNISFISCISTKPTIEAGKKNGPFIIQSANSLEHNTPVGNAEAFVKTALQNAEY